TRRSFNRDFLLALAADFKKHGAAAIEKVRKQQPAAYMKICALLVPREMKLEHSGGVKAMTDEEIERAIEAIEELIAKREAGANAKVIEGEAEVDPPVGGTFHFENLIMPPLTKTCPKMVLSHKGGSLCVKDAFAKKFFGVGRDSAGGALASVLRKHSTEGRTPDAIERCAAMPE